MRIHLFIQRHELPATRILWTIPTRMPAGGYTIAQLLADVDEIVPLESQPSNSEDGKGEEYWGLEDYVVELMGSECLHFMEVENLLRDGDELVIRPLHYEELEIRQITGRHQISTNGTHLIDGVPFGKRYLKRSTSSRPSIAIPPRNKRRRIDETPWRSDRSARGGLPVTNSPPRSEGEEVLIDKDVGTGPVVLQQGEAVGDQKSQETVEVHGGKCDAQKGELCSSPQTVTTIMKVAEESGDHASAINRGLNRASLNQHDHDNNPVEEAQRSILSSSSSESSVSESEISNSAEDSSEEEISSSESSSSISSTSITSDDDSEGMGSRRTKHSNLRTKLRRRLAKMKESGVLPQNANFDDLRAWDRNGMKALKTPMETVGIELSELEKRRIQLLQDIERGGIDVTPVRHDDQASQGKPSTDTAADTIEEEVPQKRMKLDMASTRRLVLGSLGLRARNIEKAKVEGKLKASEPEEHAKEPTESATKTQALMPVENWQDFINLKATECIYQDVTIPPPPFPFVQRWDAESQKQIREQRNLHNPRGRKRKRKSRAYEDEEIEDHSRYNYSNVDITLNYSDNDESSEKVISPIEKVSAEYQDELQGNYVQSAQSQENIVKSTPAETEEDLPIVEDVSSLPGATENDLKPGAIIVFKQLEVSKSTGWQPVVSCYRTAIIEEVLDNSTMQLRLAKRDRKERPQSQDSGPRSPDRIPESVLQEPDEAEIFQVSSQTRREISQLIDDAGFRSGIDSDLNIPEEAFPAASVAQVMEEESDDDDDDAPIQSPAFSGFEKSPAAEPCQQTSRDIPTDTGETEIHAEIKGLSSVQTSFTGNSAQQVNSALTLPSMPSDDGLHYITDLDTTVVGAAVGDASQFSGHKSRTHTPDTQLQQLKEPEAASQAESLLSTVPPTIQENENDTHHDRPDSSSSMVTNPFYEIDRVLFQETSDALSLEKMISSTAPARTTELPTPKKRAESKRRAMSTPRQRFPEPKFVYKDDDKDGDYVPGLSSPPKVKKRSKSTQQMKGEPMGSQPRNREFQIPEGSQVIDLCD
ncbi:predicted protein [Uncinocarpus reesii 1704]|uniref:DUF7357 domain-containing protein n=1 Tax=Uncinocarpus reesii (strain UAMH 1704) TaxID=336963 RepID=C4JKG4_UNCRE|nr:uncharacterized protein UREG_02121 [Uncinocarpus reesii 1704]EEP77272.1 predicted protein [Uncinocarpus reesii 1704]